MMTPPPTRCDRLVTADTVLTAEPAAPQLDDAAIAITGGRIAWLGPARDLPPNFAASERIALPGHVVIPGLVNVHTHTILTMVRGVAEDLGFAPAYTPGIPQGHMVEPDEAVALARLGACEALLFGSTLINDSYVHADLTLPAMAELGMRVHTCARIHDVDFAGVAGGSWVHDPAIGARTLDAALALAQRFQGGFAGRAGVQLAAHAPDTCSDSFLRAIADCARAQDLRVTTHLSQSLVENRRIEERSGKTPAELLESVGLLNDRLIAAHCIHVTQDDIARIGRARVTVAHIPKGNATGGTMAPTLRLRAVGARIALGTDNMHADMIEVMRWAVAISRLQAGGVIGGWQPEDALAMATLEGARAMGLDSEIGSLAVGKQADLVALDFRRVHLTPAPDPLGTLVHVGQGRDVALVMVDGEVIVRDGRPTRVDLDAIRRAAAAAADALWRRARAT
jgi:5-methylthioadenosine/S-adenosylhomocysteine deaminase